MTGHVEAIPVLNPSGSSSGNPKERGGKYHFPPSLTKEYKMEQYIFSLEAVSSMLSESYRRGNSIETGGILIGLKNNKRIVTDIINSSAFAERRAATYYQSEQDVRIINQQLSQFQANGYDFNGYWHRHPSGLYQLSSGDEATCVEILQSPNYKINNRLLMCIVTESDKDFPVFGYLVSLGRNNQVVIKETKIKVLPKRCIEECMDNFETKGENDEESIYSRQSDRGNEKPGTGNTIRVQKGRISFCNLPVHETGHEKSGSVQLECRRF